MAPRRTYPADFVEPCVPTLAAKPPAGPGWVHDIKRDGYRLIVRREGATVRLFTRRRCRFRNDQAELTWVE